MKKETKVKHKTSAAKKQVKTGNRKTAPQVYDVLISGAGPAGMSAAILCAEKGMSVLICEKERRPAPRPRAETVYDHPLFDHLVRPGFINEISLYKTAGRRFNSPGGKKSFSATLTGDRVSNVFEWKKLIDGLWNRVKESGIEIEFKAEVKAPLIEEGICKGVECTDGRRFYGRTVLACDGHRSLMGSSLGIPYNKMNAVIVKSIITGLNSDYDGFEYFYIGYDELPYAPGFPTAVAFIFPRGKGEAETGLYIPPVPFRKTGGAAGNISPETVLDTWHNLMKNYPGLSERFRNAAVKSEIATYIPAGGLYEKASPVPGLIFCGDAIGFIEATGVSGIITSLEMSQFVSEYLKLNPIKRWTPLEMEVFNREFSRSEIFRYVKKRYRITRIYNFLIFFVMGRAESINRWWRLISTIYRLK